MANLQTNDDEELEKLENHSDDASNLPGKSNLKGDWLNFFLLLLLYTIQGLPLGFAVALPIIFQSKRVVSYREQAFFSLVSWPYSAKLLWAPIVDSLYVRRIGRRKSWLIPVQLLMGAFLFYTATKIDEWLPESEKPNLKALVYAFSVITFLAATQDIVVDGWALTMLKQNNVGHSSTCNGTGLALGVLIGMVGPVLLTSEDFCNKYLRFTDDTGGIITIKSFLYFWSIAFILITILIVTFKKENDFDESETKINIFQNYKLLWQILRLQNVRVLVVALLTMKIGFSATDAVSHLKLIDAGISKNNIMLIQISMYVVKFIIPLVVSKYTSGLKPMSAYMNLMPIRLLWSFTYVILIYYTPALINTNGVVDVPIYYYVILGLICTVHEILSFTMFIFTIGFFSRISDKRFGGTYMTMLTTIANFGWAVSNTIALRMIDVLTFSKCSNDVSNNCSTPDLKTVCQTNRGECVTAINGYYLEVILCVTIGFVWYYIYKGIVRDLQSMNPSNWLVNIPRPNMKRDENNIITR